MGALVLIQTNNHNLLWTVGRGSESLLIHDLAIEPHQLCVKYKIALGLNWEPKKDNITTADKISKCKDSSNWMLKHIL